MIRSIPSITAALLCAAFAIEPALAQSTINTGMPGSNADLTSLVVRQQFQAAATDINGLLSKHAATSVGQCPATPYVGEDCITIGSQPYGWNLWSGGTFGWTQFATINPTTGVVALTLNSGEITGTNPIVVGFPSGVATVGLNFNSSLLMDGGNNLGINLANGNTWTATQSFPAGSITNTELANSTISGISLGSNLAALTFGTHLAAGGTSYNGSAAVTISSDATSLNTASAIVARDSSGNFAAGTITASLTGHASLDLALTSLGTNVQTALGNTLNAAGGLVGFSGNLGTPTGGIATNLTGTAAGLTAGTVTTNANLSGDVTSVGNTTTLTNAPVIAKVLTGFTSGAGTVSATDSILSAFQKINGNDALKLPLAGGVMSGAISGMTTLSMSGQLTSTLATGTAPFSVASTTNVANLNASSLNGATFAAPGAIGGTTPASGAFTTLSASSTFSLNNGGSWGGTISGTPILSGANFVTRANLAQVAGLSLSGNPMGSLANESAITLGSTLSFSGSTLNCTAGSATQSGCLQIDNSTITIIGGKIVASGGSATQVTLLGTTVSGGGASGNLVSITSTGCSSTTPCMTQTSLGSVGQHLGVTGSAPAYKSGGWELLSSTTANNTSATLTDGGSAITTAYNEYEIEIDNIVCATSGQSLQLQVLIGGTPQTSGYSGQLIIGNTSTAGSQSLTTGIALNNTSGCPTTAPGTSAKLHVFQPAVAGGSGKMFHGDWSSTGVVGGTTNGYLASAGALSGVQINVPSGNLVSGSLRVKGSL